MMEPIAIDVFIIILIAISGVGVYMGLDYRKPASWLFALPGIISGAIVGSLRNEIISGLLLGVFVGLIVMGSSAVVRLQRKLFSSNQRDKEANREK